MLYLGLDPKKIDPLPLSHSFSSGQTGTDVDVFAGADGDVFAGADGDVDTGADGDVVGGGSSD
jgi:hypothetical protein